MQQQIPDCVSHFDACRITNANLMLGSRVFCIPSNYIDISNKIHYVKIYQPDLWVRDTGVLKITLVDLLQG